MDNKVSVTVPATTANLGPGFDCLGLALDLRNRVSLTTSQQGLIITVRGEGQGTIPIDESNLVFQAAERVFQSQNIRPNGLRIDQENHIPVGSGLGSSAAAALAGIMAANALIGNPLPREQMLQLATEIEGHPDNVAPALYGGLVFGQQGW